MMNIIFLGEKYMYKIFVMKKSQVMMVLSIICTYITFIFLDILNVSKINYSTKLKFLSIVLCFLLSLLIDKNGYDKKDTLLLQSALFLTTSADFSLLFLNNYIIGVSVFCIVQIIYIIRHSRNHKSNKGILKWFKFIMIIIFLIIINLNTSLFQNSLIVICGLYEVLLLTSVYVSFRTIKREFYPNLTCRIITAGMILFMLCDINVAIANLNFIYDILLLGTIKLQAVSQFLIWIFYLHSQLLLALSGYKLE